MAAILRALQQELNNLPSQERRIAEVIMQSPSDIPGWTISHLAEQSGTSAATVTRFCKSFHFKGFPDFKMKLAAELSHASDETAYQDIVAGNSLSKIVEAIEANHLASISDTTRLLDLGRLEQAVQLLCQARRIDLYGVATSSIVTQDFYQKLVRIGKSCTAFPTHICRLHPHLRSPREMWRWPYPIQAKHRRPSMPCIVPNRPELLRFH